MRTLKLIFKLDNEKTATCSLADPREDLTAAEVQLVASDIIAQQALMVGDSYPIAVKDTYILESDQTRLA